MKNGAAILARTTPTMKLRIDRIRRTTGKTLKSLMNEALRDLAVKYETERRAADQPAE